VLSEPVRALASRPRPLANPVACARQERSLALVRSPGARHCGIGSSKVLGFPFGCRWNGFGRNWNGKGVVPHRGTFRSLAAAVLLLWFAGGCHEFERSQRSTDAEIALFDDLYAVAVIDGQRAIAVGYHGSIYRTGDGGQHWHKAESSTSRSLYSVSMADAAVGWAVGQYGTIIRTVDGGRTWAIQPSLEGKQNLHLFGVHVVDANTAWVVGVWGTRILTRDGGVTWSDHSVPVTLDHPLFAWLSTEDQEKVRGGGAVYEDVALNDVYCRPRPSEMCWIVGEFGTIFRSEDLGRTWIRGSIDRSKIDDYDTGVAAAETPYLFTVRFGGERDGLIAGLGGVVLRSLDGGRDWGYATTDLRRSFFSIAHVADRFVAVGEKGLVRFSTDGGKTWTAPAVDDLPVVFSFLRDLDFDAAGKVGYSVGRGGMILRSDDAGRRWKSVLPPSDPSRGFLPTAGSLLKRATPTADFGGGGG
jgi:photosystem II stability/assembly factor-like uncharacterized protein